MRGLGALGAAVLAVFASTASADLEVSPSNVDFGSQTVGVESLSTLAQLCNIGSDPITVESIIFSDPSYSPQDPGPVSDPVPPFVVGAACVSFWFACTPTQIGSHDATVTYTTDTQTATESLECLAGPMVDAPPSMIVFSDDGPSTARLTNNSAAFPATITSLTFSDPSFSLVDGPTFPFDIAPWGGSDLEISCSAPQLGSNFATAEVVATLDGAPAGTDTIALNCFRFAPFVLDPAPIVFGLQPLGSASPPTFATVANHSGSAVSVTLATSGSDAGDFQIDASQPIVLADGSIASFEITFTPSHAGDEVAELDVLTGSGTPLATAALTGTGFQIPFTVSARSANFGPVVVGTSSTYPLTITNTSGGPLDLTLAMSGDPAFAVQPTATLAAGQAVTVDVSFAPQTFGATSATLSIEPTPQDLTIALAGSGLLASLDASPARVDFGSVSASDAPPQTVTITNASTTAVPIDRITSSNATFVIEASLPTTLAGGASMTFTVGLAPSAVGPARADLMIYPDAASVPAAMIEAAVEANDAPTAPAEHGGGCDASGSSRPWSKMVLGGAIALILRRRGGKRS